MMWWRKCSISWVALALAASTLLLPTRGSAYRVPEHPAPLPVNEGDPDQPPPARSAKAPTLGWLLVIQWPLGPTTVIYIPGRWHQSSSRQAR